MNLSPSLFGLWCGVLGVCVLAGCSSTTPSRSAGDSVSKGATKVVSAAPRTPLPAPAVSAGERPPPTELGVRVARDGNAVAEIAHPPEKVFELMENNLRKRGKVTFINSHVGRLEAVEGHNLYEVDIVLLPTGKTGLSVIVKVGAEKKVDSEAARKLADECVALVKALPKPPVTKLRA